MDEELIRIEAPHFVAGIIVIDGKCVRPAPILKWTRGKDVETVRAYCERRGWKFRLTGV